MNGKKGFIPQLSRAEVRRGAVLFPIYFFLMPALFGFLANFFRSYFHITVDAGIVNFSFYVFMTLLIFLLFHRFLGQSFGKLLQKPGSALLGILIGLVFYFGFQVILSPITETVENLNNNQMVSQAIQTPWLMFVMTVILAPIVEETLFRGLVFGTIRKSSRIMAYVVSTLLFCLLHVWQQIFATWDPRYFSLMLPYVAPSLALAWCYEKSESIWAPMVLHGGINAIAMVTVLW